MYIPPGYGTVTPYLFVRDAPAFIRFLIDGLGGQELCRTLGSDGRVANAQIQIGTSAVMVSEATPAYPAMASAYYLYVENADVAMARALAAGALKVMDVADMPYGDRQGGVQDVQGNYWWLSQRLVQAPYSAR